MGEPGRVPSWHPVNDARLPARLPPPQLARAAVAPTPLVAGAAGAVVGFLAFPPFGALIGIGTWGVGAAVSVARRLRRRRPAPIDPFALHDPWRRHVQHALAAQRRFREAMAQFPEGPLRLRLGDASRDLDEGVAACWRVAQRGELLYGARRSIDTNRILADLTTLDRAAPANDGGGDANNENGANDSGSNGNDGNDARSEVQAHTRAALESQLASAERLDATIAETRARLRLLDARLTEAVTNLVELAATGTPEGSRAGVDDAAGTIRGVSEDLDALRLALEELQRPPDALDPELGQLGSGDDT